MPVRTEATIEDLASIPEQGKAELIKGELVLMAPTGGLPHVAGGEIFASLRAYARLTKRGHAITDNAGFVVNLPQRKSLSPDATFFLGDITMKFLDGAPVFAVEIRSENDYGNNAETEMAQKRADYFAAGTLVVWDVDLLSPEVIRIYRKSDPKHPTLYRRGEQAEAEPALPGWTMPVDDLFP